MASLFTTETPTSVDNSDGSPGISVGTTVRFTAEGTVTGIRFYATTTVGGTYTGALYQVTAADDPSPAGTLLASKTLGTTPTGGTWNTIAFDPEDYVSVTTGVLYRAVLFSGAGRYVYAPNIHTSDIVSGDIIADANGDDPVLLGSLRQATFAINASLTYPFTVAGSSGSYFADVAFTPGGGPTPVDVADTGAAADVLAVSAAAPVADLASSAEALSTAVLAALADTGVASEALSVAVAVALADTGAGVDAADGDDGSAVSKSLAEAGSASERMRITTVRPYSGITARPDTGITLRP